jgi:hypothetical protein
VIPLYLKQDQASVDDLGVSPALTRKLNDDVPAPAAVMAYPPLAYFLNSILSGLNFLRECPMLSAKEALLAELVGVLLDSCVFFVELSSDISVRGAKYLPQEAAGRGAATGTEKASTALSMDAQYAAVLAQELIPHILVCFEHIYNCQPPPPAINTEKEKGNKGRGKAVVLRVEVLSSARASMGPVSYAALTTCWGLFRKAGLIPAERVTPDPIRQLTPPTIPEADADSSEVPTNAEELLAPSTPTKSQPSPDVSPLDDDEDVPVNKAEDAAAVPPIIDENISVLTGSEQREETSEE